MRTTNEPAADLAPAPTGGDGAGDFAGVRSRLLGVAFRVLGGAADAEDVVQDVWIRWQGTDRARVRDRTAYLVTATTRAALNVVTSARVRRELPVGDGMPDHGRALDDPATEAERTEALASAVLVLMERLSPMERAVLVLREAFDYPFRVVADALGVSEPNARQLACRARIRLAGPRRTSVDRHDRDQLLAAFRGAAGSGEVARLERVLVDAVRRQQAA